MMLADIRVAIGSSAARASRDADTIQLLAVSKTRTSTEIEAVYDRGVTSFGENYLQEALEKIRALESLAIEWHFIGPIQSNKTRDIATNFHWVHTIDRPRVARRLSDTLAQRKRTIDACIQLNVDREPQKAGVMPDDLGALVAEVRALPHIRLRGLMVIPRADTDPRSSFARTRAIFDEHKATDAPEWDTLSMGMSSDFEIAIEEGATMVRIGTAIFGPRPDKKALERVVT